MPNVSIDPPTDQTPTVRLAFAGAGNVTSGPYHHAVIRSSAAELVGVYDPDADAAERLASLHGARTYPDLGALLADDTVQGVVVGTPNHLHFEVAEACLRAGKHVLIEKPVAQQVEEIDALNQLATSLQLVAMPAHNFIYQSTLEKARSSA